VTSPEARPTLAVVLVGLIWLASVGSGLWGRDFGEVHWDEPTTLLNASFMWREGAPLPRNYVHPTGAVLLLAAALTPDVVGHDVDAALAGPRERREALLRGRSLFVLVTSTAVLAAALAAWSRRRAVVDAVVAALLVAGSFELSTHARFLVPDGPLVAAVSWSLCFMLLAERRPRLLLAAAFCAGLACGTKYTGATLGAPLLVAAWRLGWRRPPDLAALVGAGLAGLVVATPGLLVEPALVVGAFRYQQGLYRAGFFGYAIPDTAARLQAIMLLLGGALMSNVVGVAAAVAGAAVVGLVDGLRRRRHDVIVLAVGVAAWVIPLALHPTHIARNHLPLVFVFAVLAAASLSAGWRVARVLPVVLVVAGVVSVVDVGRAAATVGDSRGPVVELAAWVDDHADEPVLASPAIIEALAALRGQASPSLQPPPGPTAPRWVLAFPEELLPLARWGGADPFLAERVFGPREINWNLYPTWGGPPRAVLVDIGKARRLGLWLTLDAPVELGNQPPMPAWLEKRPGG
jgi:hypothetical protein